MLAPELKILPLLNHIKKYMDVSFSSDDINFFEKTILIREYKKGTILLKEGEISSRLFFNIKGCVRLYYIVDGVEKTANFYSENQFITAFESYTKKIPSTFYFECVEDCNLAVLSYETEYLILEKFPKLKILSSLILEEELGIYQNIVASFVTLSPQERYLNLVNNHSDLLKEYLNII